MTKVSVFGETEKEEKKELKKIEFVKYITERGELDKWEGVSPKGWGNIILLIKSDSDAFDTMMVTDNAEQIDLGLIVLGHWNDGVV
jgi:hypothetical protein